MIPRYLFPVFECPGDLAPGGKQSFRRHREIACDYPPQLGQIVVWDRRKHMVFDVIIHIPVEKANDRPGEVGSRTLPPIGHIGLHSEVLRRVGENTKPSRGKWCEGNEQD